MQLPESIWRLPADVRGEVLRFACEVQAEAKRPARQRTADDAAAHGGLTKAGVEPPPIKSIHKMNELGVDQNAANDASPVLSMQPGAVERGVKPPHSKTCPRQKEEAMRGDSSMMLSTQAGNEEEGAGASSDPPMGEFTRHARPFLTAVTAAFVGPYNPRGVNVEVKKRMRLDPQVALGLAAIKSPVMNVTRDGGWWIDAPSPEIRDVLTALLRPLVRDLFRSCLNAVEFGHQAHEKVWELRRIGGSMFYAYRKLKDLEPGTFELLADEMGRYAGLRQPHMDEPIPAAKTFVMTLNKEWGNLYGRGRLDACYEPWYWSSVIYMFANRYFERKADPVVKAYGPPEVRRNPSTGIDEHTLDSLNATLGSLRSSGSITLPDERDEHGNRRWDVEYLLDDQRGEMFRSYLEHLDAKKVRALFVPERSITQDGSVGSHAAARQYADTFLLMEAGLLQDIVGQVNEFVVRPLAAVNFGEAAADGVRLVTSGISRENDDVLIDVLRLAIEAEKSGGRIGELIDRLKLLEQLNVPMTSTQAA